MYAIIETGGKQYKAAIGDVIYIEKLDAPIDSTVNFKVVACYDGKTLQIGNPYVEKAGVSGKILKSDRAKKITIFTYKPKKNCKRKIGHRQWYTKVQIENITF